MMKDDLKSLPEMAKKQPNFALLISLLSLPFDSLPVPVKASLNGFRETVNEERSNPFISIEKSIKKVFEEALAGDGEIRILQKKIVLQYTLVDKPSEKYTATFEHDYSQECANPNCKKWRTTAHKLQKCSRCLQAYYCDRDCQIAHWKAHKAVCISNPPKS